MKPRFGFTLLELLIVMGLSSLLLLGSLSAYRQTRMRLEVENERTTLAKIFRKARGLAQRLDRTARVKFSRDGAVTLEVEDPPGVFTRATWQPSAKFEAQYSYDGRTWQPLSQMPGVTYSPPYGETSATSLIIRFRHRQNPRIGACVRIIGVTGKVVIPHECP